MRLRFIHSRPWKRFVDACLVILILLIIVQLAAQPSLSAVLPVEHQEALDLSLSIVLFADVLLLMLEAKDKIWFVRKNYMKIVLVLPFALVLRAFSLARIFEFVPFLARTAELTKGATIVDFALHMVRRI
ncbi:MAG: hypothetical protein ACP5NX_00135 [Candidatus Bilamarchaeaceae archaeon]